MEFGHGQLECCYIHRCKARGKNGRCHVDRKAGGAMHYLFGGSSSSSEFQSDLWMFPYPEAQAIWSEVRQTDFIDRPAPRARSIVWMPPGKTSLVYVFGGVGLESKYESGTNAAKPVEFGDLWEYDCEHEQWREIWTAFASLAPQFAGALATVSFVYQTRVLVHRPPHVNTIWEFNLESAKWSKLFSNSSSTMKQFFQSQNGISHVLEEREKMHLLQYRFDQPTDIAMLTLQHAALDDSVAAT
eukprot:gb/GECG01010099.1/.p1 GENE.gb/GECG01010099.1/~~gb/GECG01010099.1/.p1  ORF type:complete len:243 (+),score=23.69 gb/GECG01010099.1/:1-729(+)